LLSGSFSRAKLLGHGIGNYWNIVFFPFFPLRLQIAGVI
jgi:hypothetical protein